MNRVSRDLEKREITAPVLVPDEVDYHGHVYNKEEVHKACRNYQDNCQKASIQHQIDITKSTAHFVEHYIAPADMTFQTDEGEILVKEGTWMATMKISNDHLWEDVQKGKFTGFSIKAVSRSLEVEKAKVAGRAAAEKGVIAEKQLFDIDFSKEDHHVALVDEAANATKVLVVKAKHSPDNPVTKPDDPVIPESVNQNKEDKMDLEKENKDLLDQNKVQVEKNEELNSQLEEISKAKEAQEAKIEELKKAKEAQEAKIEELQKEKEQREVAELVVKAKEMKADEPEQFATILQKCKYSLEEDQYEALCKQLNKLANIEDNAEFLKEVGEGKGSEEQLEKNKDKKFYERREELIKEGKPRHEASKIARQELEQK